MLKVFLDATVLFSAAYSTTGASRELIHQALEGKVILCASTFVIQEAERNLTKKAPQKIPIYYQLIELLNLVIVRNPTKAELLEVAAYTQLKDAPVVAAAQIAQADYLVTFDHKHLLDPPEVARRAKLQIVVPDVVVKVVRPQQLSKAA